MKKIDFKSDKIILLTIIILDTQKKIKQKYEQLGENPETHLQGLLHSKPITYWDYVEVDTLLSLQKPRTHFKDESIFIMYHQLTEIVLKMMRHELEQIVEVNTPTEDFLISKIERLSRYTAMLITSFDVMKHGMNYDDYNEFRKTLTPASGFQSAQFRYIEILSTRLESLVNNEGKKRLPAEPDIIHYFENIYWKNKNYICTNTVLKIFSTFSVFDILGVCLISGTTGRIRTDTP